MNPYDPQAIGERFRARKRDRKLSNTAIAEQAHISRRSVLNLSAGIVAPRADTLYKVCQVLECSLDWLVTGTMENA